MKKILSIALAVVMVLSLASVAMAFNWSAPTSSLTDFGYQIDVIKFTTTTQAYGSASFQEDNAATAVNGAPVYFAIKLTVPDLAADNDIRESARATVEFTAIDGVGGVDDLDISGLSKGVYYYYDATQSFQKIEFFRANVRGMNYMAETPVYAMTCLDTDTAKVYAEVSSDRPLGRWFSVGGYDIGKTNVFGNATSNGFVGTPITRKNETQGTKTAAQYFAVGFGAINFYQAGTVTYTIGDLSVTVEMAAYAGQAANIAQAVANKLGSEVTINGNTYYVRYDGGNNTAIAFTEKYASIGSGNTPIYNGIADNYPAVSATLGDATGGVPVVEFREAAEPIGSGDLVAVLPLNSSDKVLAIIGSAAEATSYKTEGGDPIQVAYGGNAPWAGTAATIDLLEWLDDGNAGSFKDAVVAGQVYMTDDNMRAAFGFANKVSDQITWQANSTPIILDPTVSIPKTGDNASVIGFAMIMAAVVLAAVAVKKVKA